MTKNDGFAISDTDFAVLDICVRGYAIFYLNMNQY